MRSDVASGVMRIGSELLRGQVMDTISACLADGFTCAGLPVAFRTAAGDLIGLDTLCLTPLRNGRAGP
jgi:molybdopterin-biosynthesis enzyme MoeA-like protein